MTEDPGYKIINGPTLSSQDVNAAMAEISMDNLKGYRGSISSVVGVERLGWGANCDRLLLEGVNPAADEYLSSLLNGTSKDARTHSQNVVVWIQNPSQLQRSKAGRNRVFIYRAIEGSLGPENGFFRIVEGSQRMSLQQVLQAEAKDVRLDPGQTIILDGELAIEYPQDGGGVGLMKCIWKK